MAQTLIGFATSIEIVQQQKYSANSVNGLKRAHEQIDANSVFRDITNITVVQDPSKRHRIDACGKNRIEASRIHDVTNKHHTHESEHNRRQLAAPTLGPSQNPLFSLSHARYGLPEALVKNFASLGIYSIYSWQSSCLLGHGLLSGEKNLVYTAPTGGGKSLVADVLMLKRVIEDPAKKAILVLPYVALVQEKLKWLRKVVEGVRKSADSLNQSGSQHPKRRKPHDSSVRVVGFFGGSKARANWADADVAVCTIEKVLTMYTPLQNAIILMFLKANALVNTAIEDCTINDLGVVVLDELHMINDDHRGYLMELMASKLLVLESHVQIVGMSATLTVQCHFLIAIIPANRDRIPKYWQSGLTRNTTILNMCRFQSRNTWYTIALFTQCRHRVPS